MAEIIAGGRSFKSRELLCQVSQLRETDSRSRVHLLWEEISKTKTGEAGGVDYLGSLVLEPHLNHTDAQSSLCSQSLPHLQEIEHVSIKHDCKGTSQSRRKNTSWVVRNEAYIGHILK